MAFTEHETHFKQLLIDLRACSAARAWAEGMDLKTAWDTCEHGDWLLWLSGRMADKPGWPTRKAIVSVACDCAELALSYITAGDNRLMECIRVVRAWVRGEATIDEVRTAHAVAAAATSSAAVAAAATYASYASSVAFGSRVTAATATAYASSVDAASAAATTTSVAAWCAAPAAAVAAATSSAAVAAAAAAAKKKVQKQCADIVRKALRPDGI